jgi:hypothetical protein
LLFLALAASVVPAVTVGVLTFVEGRDALRKAALSQLEVATEARRERVLDYLKEKLADAVLIARTEAVVSIARDMVGRFETADTLAGKALDTKSAEFQLALDRADGEFGRYAQGLGFHNLFLLCPHHGHLLYSQERHNDLGQPVSGQLLAGSSLEVAWRKVKETGKPLLTDFAWYKATEEWALIFAAPVVDENGRLLAVLAAQLETAEFHSLVTRGGGLGQTGLVFLVGPNKVLRSPLADNESAAFMETVMDLDYVEQVVRHETPSGDGVDDHGEAVLFYGAHAELNEELGTDFEWGIIGEIEQSEAYAAVFHLGRDVAGLSAVVVLVILILTFFFVRRIAAPIRAGVSVIAASSEQISATASELAAAAAQAAAAVAETTVTVEEVKQTAMVAADKARMVANQAQSTSEVASTGTQAVAETIERMEAIRAQMETVAEAVVRLSEHSQAIGEIISAVDDLAEQSNLLAVNASIEAAKAGEHGKGFGVVAQEVKSLAEQSKEATRQVRVILNDIQKATGAAVMATEQGAKSVAAGADQSQEAGMAIGELAESIREAVAAAHQIAASSQQQLSGVEQVTDAMEGIRQASSQNEDGARQLDDAVRSISQVGKDLRALVDSK